MRPGQGDLCPGDDAGPGDFRQLTGALWRAAEDRSQPMPGLILDGLSPR
ncbi:hypothetical protein [Amycolatopsis sp.]|nr:hypothetical protein [Amycolatopsis sp.]HVV11287.1 hypothetical protein [Amycolatopsis sp.]